MQKKYTHLSNIFKGTLFIQNGFHYSDSYSFIMPPPPPEVCKISHELVAGLEPNLHGYISWEWWTLY